MKNTYGIEVDPELQIVQQACLQILKKFRDVCDNNSLRYYLGYGTLLGAIRHNGFIPWDDDIDIWMPRKDFNKFLALCEEQMKPYVINYYSIDNEAAFKYRTQLCIEDHSFPVGFSLGDKVKKGYIWIDIMTMDGMPESKLGRKIQCKKFSFWYAVIGLARSSRIGATSVKNKKGIKKIAVYINNFTKFGKVINIKKAFNAFVRTKSRYDFEKTTYIHGSSSFYTDKAVFKREWFDGTRQAEFEGEYFSIPFDAEKVLTSIYGDYMFIPPVEKRSHRHFVELNYAEGEPI